MISTQRWAWLRSIAQAVRAKTSRGSASKLDILQTGAIGYTGEQDGVPERTLKSALREMLAHHRAIERAYLARGRADGEAGIYLCLISSEGAREEIVRDCGATFAAIFNNRMHLDITFPSRDDEERLAAVCRPFFERSTTR